MVFPTVQITIVQGDNAGIVFRGSINDDGSGTYYIFWIAAIGHFDLFRYNTSGDFTRLISGSPPSRFLHTGLRVTNTIAVAAHGGDIVLFINRNVVGHTIDDTYPLGQIGVAANDFYNPTEVVFTNAKVWQL